MVSIKLEMEGVILSVVNADAPQVGCEMEVKGNFWSELDNKAKGLTNEERLIIGTDFNGHVDEGNLGDEEVMGRFGVGNSFSENLFQEKVRTQNNIYHGGRATPADYLLCRRPSLKEVGNCKVKAGERLVTQHRTTVRSINFRTKKKRMRAEPKINEGRLSSGI